MEAKAGELGITYDPWQQGAGRIVLGKRKDGKYAATVGGVTLSIPRQVGKTFWVGSLIVILCILFPGLRVLWTAHHGATTANTFASMQGLCRRKKVWPHIKPRGIVTGNGKEKILFRNGSQILFGAREHGFGRGLDAIDVEVFDEAQILKSKTLEDMVPATNQARHPHGALLFFIGTPPTPDNPGEEFTWRRTKALDGKMRDGAYVEFGADPDSDPDDRDQWRKANPSFPHRTPLESMLRMRENLGNEQAWKREALGIWDAVAGHGVLPAPSWKDAEDTNSLATDRFALGVECGPDLAYVSVSLAGQREDGDWHFELDDDQHTRGAGVAWLVPHIEAYVAANPQIRAVMVDVAGPIAALLEQDKTGRWFFKGTKVEVTPIRVAELGAACSLVLDGIVTGWLHHIGQPQFSAAALSAGKRALGDTGKWVWSRKLSTSDITPIQAATLALAGAQNSTVKKPSRAGSGRRVATVL